MNYVISISGEDYAQLKSFTLFLSKLVFAVDQSKQEEEHDRNIVQIIKEESNIKSALNLILKELKKMPKSLVKIFSEKWLQDHTRTRANGLLEIRCTINKIPLSGSGKTVETAAKNFVNSLLSKIPTESTEVQKGAGKNILLNEFAATWFETVKKPTVKPITYQSFIALANVHIYPYFNNKKIRDITAMQIQPLFTSLTVAGKTKAAVTLRMLLSQIFRAAIGERIITLNPMDGVAVLKHHAKKGVALTYEEERAFLIALGKSKYLLTFTLMLFCGMRRDELKSAERSEYFITVKDGKKRLDEPESRRKIPITPMLRKYLLNVSEEEFAQAISYSNDLLSREFKKFCPKHHLHELRHTFITRCQECGVSREVVSVWAGHASDNSMTSNVYTHFSEEFFISEANKIDYFKRLNL